MAVSSVRVMVLASMVTVALCSCVTMTGSKKTAPPTSGKAPGTAQAKSVDAPIVDTWELIYQINEQGDQEMPRESTRTLIEFRKDGHVVMNRIDRTTSDPLKSRSGSYNLSDNEISIIDDRGNSVKWPYRFAGNMLIISMPELKKKFYLQRYR